MRKAVYGRKPARSAFVVSDIFGPATPERKQARSLTRDENDKHDDILETSKALENLNIRDEDVIFEQAAPRRAALRDLGSQAQPSRQPRCETKRAHHTKTKQTDKARDNGQSSPEISVRSRRRQNVEQATKDTELNLSVEEKPPSDPYVRSLLELTNDQKTPLQFEDWSDNLIPHFSISKIAEASYSEVYRLSLLDEHPSLTSADESVLKLIAIKPQHKSANTKKSKAQQNREDGMSSTEDIVSEVKLLKRMTEVPGFTNYRALHILKGRPSKPFVQAWKEWNKARRKGEKSEFPDPSRKANYEEGQYWAVIEMQDAGTDVERLLEDTPDQIDDENESESNMRSIWSVWDIFWQTTLAVAKGESSAMFEHRDLHLGNICVRRKEGMDQAQLTHALKKKKKLGFTNIEATIIDYTLSRAEMAQAESTRSQSSSCCSVRSTASSKSTSDTSRAEIAYNQLQNQPQVFQGDADVDYQYEIYRHMRSLMHSKDSQDIDIWKQYQPKTNLLWLHFVLHKLLEAAEQSLKVKMSTAVMRRKASELEDILGHVENLLDIDRLLGKEECLLSSTTELIAVALEQGWLDAADINS